MEKTIGLTFDVAKNANAKKAKDVRRVSVKVKIEDKHLDDLIQDAIRNYTIKMQDQIRRHWDEFVKPGFVLPEEVEYGDALFAGSGRGVITEAKKESLAFELCKGMTLEEFKEFQETGKVPESVRERMAKKAE